MGKITNSKSIGGPLFWFLFIVIELILVVIIIFLGGIGLTLSL